MDCESFDCKSSFDLYQSFYLSTFPNQRFHLPTFLTKFSSFDLFNQMFHKTSFWCEIKVPVADIGPFLPKNTGEKDRSPTRRTTGPAVPRYLTLPDRVSWVVPFVWYSRINSEAFEGSQTREILSAFEKQFDFYP